MKIQNAVVSNILDRSQRYFAHVTTVTLSWRVQNIVVMGRVYFTECFEFSSNFEFDRNMLSGTGACIDITAERDTEKRRPSVWIIHVTSVLNRCHVDCLRQKRHNSIANTLKLRLFCIKQWKRHGVTSNSKLCALCVDYVLKLLSHM